MRKPNTYPRSQPYNCVHCGKFGFRVVGYKSVNYLAYCSEECRVARRKGFDKINSEKLKALHAAGLMKYSKDAPRRDLETIPSPSSFEEQLY